MEKRLEDLTVEELIKVMLELHKKVYKEEIKELPITEDGFILLCGPPENADLQR